MIERYDTLPAEIDCEYHTNHEQHRPFPPAEEDLYILLVDDARDRVASKSGTTDQHIPHDVEHRIRDIQARLAPGWAALTAGEVQYIQQRFAAQYEELPTSHPLFDHQHDLHAHDDSHSCGKMHGPLRRRFDAFEVKILDRIPHRTAKAVAAAVFRLSALTICPGDDIAAIGLQVHSAAVGHHDSKHSHHEEQAILPPRLRIETERSSEDDANNDDA